MRYRSAFTAADCNSLCKLQSPRLASIGVGTARANHLDYIALLRSVPDFVSRPVAGKGAGLGGGEGEGSSSSSSICGSWKTILPKQYQKIQRR